MKEIIDFLETFCDKENDRELLQQVFQANGCLCATEAHILIRIKPDESFDLSEFPDFSDKIKDDMFIENCKHIISKSELIEAVSKIPIKDEKEEIECPECKGFGEVEWEYGHYTMDADCPKCKGDGEILTGKILKDIKQYNDLHFHIKDAYFYGRYIERLIDVCNFENLDTIELLGSRVNKSNVLRVGRFDVIIMPIYRNENFNINVTKIKYL